MKHTIFLIGILIFAVNCEDVTGMQELKTPKEMILGTWRVSIATIDGDIYPVTNPGFGQIEVEFSENMVEYIYPGVDENGMPTAKTDTLVGNWELLEENTLIHITHTVNNATLFEWGIVNLSVGLLQTSFESQSPLDPQRLSRYVLTYKLIQ